MAYMLPRKLQDPSKRLLTRVQETMSRYDLIQRGEHVVVGVSGGPDSTCLAAVLHECTEKWGFTVHLAHLNYGMRGRESELDEIFECSTDSANSLSFNLISLVDKTAA